MALLYAIHRSERQRQAMRCGRIGQAASIADGPQQGLPGQRTDGARAPGYLRRSRDAMTAGAVLWDGSGSLIANAAHPALA